MRTFPQILEEMIFLELCAARAFPKHFFKKHLKKVLTELNTRKIMHNIQNNMLFSRLLN